MQKRLKKEYPTFVLLDAKMRKEVDRIAAEESRSVSSVIFLAVKDYIERRATKAA